MNQVVVAENRPVRSVLVDMSHRYGMEPAAFEATVRATCMRPDKDGRIPSREEFAAFLLVAKEYKLNPITKEIYAYAARGGGIVPIVSIDGWVNLVNSHPQCDGFDFAVERTEEGGLFAITCTMHRKDRKHPTVVTEYLSECIRSTEPWKMQHRMLRHKALIQAARYAFGFAGIYDEDEGRTIADQGSEPPKERAAVPSPSEIEGPHGSDKYRPGDVVSAAPEQVTDAEFTEAKPDPITSGPQPAPVKAKGYTVPNIETDYEGFMSWAEDFIAKSSDGGELESWWNDEIEARAKSLFPSDMDDLAQVYNKRQAALSGDIE